MRTTVLILLFLLLSSTGSLIYSQTEDFSYGLKVLNDLQFKKAKSVFISLTEKDPTDCKSLFYLGWTLFVQQKYDSAEIFFSKIQSVNPKSPYAILGNGIIAFRAGNTESAIDLFKQAKKISKKDVNIMVLTADACMSVAIPDLNLTESFFPEIESLYPQNADFFICKAKFYLLKGDIGKAANSYEWAYYYDPNNTLAYTKLGQLYSSALLYRESITALNKSIEIDTNQVMVYKYLGDLKYKFGKYDEAKKAYQKYLAVGEISNDDIGKYAIILFYNKEFKAASAEMDKVMATDPTNPVMYRITAYVDYETGDYENGMKHISKLFELKDTSKLLAPDYLYYGKLLLKTGNDEEGIKNIRKALELDDAKTDAYIDLAAALSKNKKHDDAIAVYEKLVTKGIDLASTYFRLGKEYYYKGVVHKEIYDSLILVAKPIEGIVNDSIIAIECYTKADSFFTLVTQKTPDFVGGYLWKGRVLSLIDSDMEKGLALEPYEKVLSMLEKDNLPQNKSMIIEAYKYIAAYYYLKSESIALSDKKTATTYKANAIGLYEKIIVLDTSDIKSKEILEQLNMPVPAPTPKK